MITITADAPQALEAISEAFRAAHAIGRQWAPGAHIRCRICAPGANPSRLPIDGHAYRRRQRARRRRRGH